MMNNEIPYGPHSQILFAQKLETERVRLLNKVVVEEREFEKTDLKSIKWIGDKTLSILIDNWIRTVSQLKETPKERIEELITSPITRSQVLSHLKTV